MKLVYSKYLTGRPINDVELVNFLQSSDFRLHHSEIKKDRYKLPDPPFTLEYI